MQKARRQSGLFANLGLGAHSNLNMWGAPGMYGRLVCVAEVTAVKAMSAIIEALTTDGFIIAADGRAMSGSEIFCDRTQKIFPIRSANGPLSLAVCGASHIGLKNNTHFEVIQEVLQSASDLTSKTTRDLREYASLLITPVFRSLLQRSGGEVPKPGKTTLLLTGYVGGHADDIEIGLPYEDGIIREPRTKDTRLEDCARIYGSDKLVHSMIQNRDPRWSAYSGFPRDLRSAYLTPDGATGLARSYIAACADPMAIEMDSFCRSIGGHVHIASVTEKNGFQWIPGFEPVKPKPTSTHF